MRKGYFWTSCLAAPLWIASAQALPQTEPGNLVQQMGLKPGRWHTTGRIVSGQILPTEPGGTIPSELQAELRKKLGTPFETEDCIGRPTTNGGLILPGIKIGSDCPPVESEALGNRLRLKSICGEDGFKAETEVEASYQTTTMAAKIRVSAFSGGTRTLTKLELATSSKFVGPC